MEQAEMASINIKHVFIALFLSILVVLNLAVGRYLINWYSIVSVTQFIILQSINIGVAYGLTELVLCLFVRKDDLPQLEAIDQLPRVAVLYLTCDDALPQAIVRLGEQSYSRYDVFILDDSTDKEFKELVDASGFPVVRRESRKGFKAGNLNNWLTKYSSRYKYFVVADSDSMFDDSFVEQMIRYAEHPANHDVAIFQSKIEVWNTGDSFSRIIAIWFPLWLYPVERLANRCDTMLSVGHNCLYRAKHICQVGGFDEEYVAEDYATGLRLLEQGYRCRLVDVTSYEAVPASMRSYNNRSVRLAKQNLELLRFEASSIPLTTRLHVFMNAYSFLIWILYLPGMMLATWGGKSSFQDLLRTSMLIFGGESIHTPLVQPLAVIVFFGFYFLFLRLPLALRLGISAKDYFKSLFTFIAMTPYMIIPLVTSQLKLLLTREKVTFTVTEKGQYKEPDSRFLCETKGGLLLVLTLVLGVIRNPTALLFNAIWLIPFIISPLLICLVQRRYTATINRPTSRTLVGNLSVPITGCDERECTK